MPAAQKEGIGGRQGGVGESTQGYGSVPVEMIDKLQPRRDQTDSKRRRGYDVYVHERRYEDNSMDSSGRQGFALDKILVVWLTSDRQGCYYSFDYWEASHPVPKSGASMPMVPNVSRETPQCQFYSSGR